MQKISLVLNEPLMKEPGRPHSRWINTSTLSGFACPSYWKSTISFYWDVENPLKTKRFNPYDTNYLQLIFRKPLSTTFMPPKLETDTYHLRITTYPDEKKNPFTISASKIRKVNTSTSKPSQKKKTHRIGYSVIHIFF